MAKAPNFSNILDKQASEVSRPPPLPIGTYTFVVKGLPREDVSSKKGTPFVEFLLKITEAGPDVDEDALQEIGGITEKTTTKATFYTTEDALWRLKEFLVALGIDEDQTLRQMIADSPNCMGKVYMAHEPAQDGSDAIFAKPKKFLSAGDDE